MFKRSIIFVLLVVGGVFFTSYVNGMVESGKLPSTYDTGLTLDEAFKNSQVPVLLEFYADSCQSCRRLAPIMHEVTEKLDGEITPVMLDVANEDTQMVAELFGLEELPGVYVFDTRYMKKEQITAEYFLTPLTLEFGIKEALSRIETRVSEGDGGEKTPPQMKG